MIFSMTTPNSGGGVDDLWGEAGNDVLECYAGNDFLIGGIGDDRLSGGAGDDQIDGGDGVDTAVYAAPYAVVGVTVDLSIAGPQNTGHGFDPLSNVENLRGTQANDVLKGNDGSNKLEGSGGYDTLAGGAGNDLLDGGLGNDTASYEAATGRVVVSLGISNPQDTGAAGFDTLVGVENLIGSAYNDELSGNAGANLLDGKLGTDFLYAGAGNDTYVLKDVHKISDFPLRFAFDRVVELAGEGTDTVRVERPGPNNVVTSYWLEANVENGIVTGMDIFTLNGNELNNQLTGNSAANTLNGNDGNDTLSGSGGSDNLNGGAGNDTYVVDNAGDRVVEAVGAGIDLVLSGISWTLGANVENLILTGTNSVSGAGNTLANTLIGNSAANGLNAGDGNDRLSGAAGNDILAGGAGNDTLIGGVDLDIFLFNTALNAASNVDTVSDFSVANDTVRLENTIFTALTSAGTLNADAFHIGAAAADAEDRIIYNSATGGLFYDSDGTGAGGMTQFAKLAPGLALTNADFFVV